MDTLFTAFNMNGYAVYVWSSYSVVLVLLAIQLLLPWKRWRKLSKKHTTAHDE